MILIYKTSVQNKADILSLAPLLDQMIHGDGNWNFDLEDCDKVLRVDAKCVDPHQIIKLLRQKGYYCAELED